MFTQDVEVSANPDLDSPEFAGLQITHSPEVLLWGWVLKMALRDFLYQTRTKRGIPPGARDWLASEDFVLISHWLGVNEAYLRNRIQD